MEANIIALAITKELEMIKKLDGYDFIDFVFRNFMKDELYKAGDEAWKKFENIFTDHAMYWDDYTNNQQKDAVKEIKKFLLSYAEN